MVELALPRDAKGILFALLALRPPNKASCTLHLILIGIYYIMAPKVVIKWVRFRL